MWNTFRDTLINSTSKNIPHKTTKNKNGLRVLSSRVESPIICTRPLLLMISKNCWCKLGYVALGLRVVDLQSHPGRLKSPPIMTLAFRILEARWSEV
jgi:hypothetical protein